MRVLPHEYSTHCGPVPALHVAIKRCNITLEVAHDAIIDLSLGIVRDPKMRNIIWVTMFLAMDLLTDVFTPSNDQELGIHISFLIGTRIDKLIQL